MLHLEVLTQRTYRKYQPLRVGAAIYDRYIKSRSKQAQPKLGAFSGRGANGRLAVLLHDSKQARRQGVLGLRLAKSSHPASGGGAARACARATALPVAAAAADGARSSVAAVGAGTSISAARAVAAAVGAGSSASAARAVAPAR